MLVCSNAATSTFYESHRRTVNSDKEALTFYVFVKEIIYG